MFNAALFLIARNWEQPRLPLANKCTMKVMYIYTMVYNSAVKKNAISVKIGGARNNNPEETKTLKDKYRIFSICK